MKFIVQRVSQAKVTIDGRIHGSINLGLMVLVGFTHTDTNEKINWLCNKLIGLRIFSDENDKMNLSVKDVDGGILLISNFTLYADSNKGFRPSFIDAAKPDFAEELYKYTIDYLKKSNLNIQTGIFGAMMDVEIINSGPVSIILEK